MPLPPTPTQTLSFPLLLLLLLFLYIASPCVIYIYIYLESSPDCFALPRSSFRNDSLDRSKKPSCYTVSSSFYSLRLLFFLLYPFPSLFCTHVCVCVYRLDCITFELSRSSSSSSSIPPRSNKLLSLSLVPKHTSLSSLYSLCSFFKNK